MDLFNGEMVSYRIQARPTFDLVGIMLKEAFKTLMPSEKPILHSGQGWQYRMRLYCQQLEDRGWVQSMLRWGGCLDNAVMERFFGMLKAECFYTH